MSQQRVDVIVVGAGIAGCSVAAELAVDRSVVVLERESLPGYHSTGRSAALFTTTYGPAVIRALSRASEPYFRGQVDGAPQGVLTPRGVLFVASSGQDAKLGDLEQELGDAVVPVDMNQLRQMVPVLRTGYAVSGLFEEDASDIDVHGLHQDYVRRLKSCGGQLVTNAEVSGLAHDAAMWRVETAAGAFAAPVVINAAGAWADRIAELAGLPGLGLRPLRRTAVTVAVPDGVDPESWPMVVDAQETFYMKPDAGRLLVSPADETPSAPCDAQPEELDVAICIDRLQTAMDVPVRRIESKWAGLRSFLPDGNPAAGYDAGAEGFFWLAGQGGYGIQTAPALARVSAALVRQEPLPEDVVAQGVSVENLSPARGGLSR